MKKYVVAVDISPSEQLHVGPPVKSLGLLVGLRKPRAFEEVGSKFPVEADRMRFRKWAGASDNYKRRLVRHLEVLRPTGNVLFGAYVASDVAIQRIGTATWEAAWGAFPSPTSHNKKGKPRIKLGGYEVDGKMRACFCPLGLAHFAHLKWPTLSYWG